MTYVVYGVAPKKLGASRPQAANRSLKGRPPTISRLTSLPEGIYTVYLPPLMYVEIFGLHFC
jgi:hypothetical protein